jgi:hypothetical protein
LSMNEDTCSEEVEKNMKAGDSVAAPVRV